MLIEFFCICLITNRVMPLINDTNRALQCESDRGARKIISSQIKGVTSTAHCTTMADEV